MAELSDLFMAFNLQDGAVQVTMKGGGAGTKLGGGLRPLQMWHKIHTSSSLSSSSIINHHYYQDKDL